MKKRINYDAIALISVIAIGFIGFGYGGILGLIDDLTTTHSEFILSSANDAQITYFFTAGRDYYFYGRIVGGPLTLEILNGSKIIFKETFNIFLYCEFHVDISGNYTIRVSSPRTVRWTVVLFRTNVITYLFYIHEILIILLFLFLVIAFAAVVLGHGIKTLKELGK